MVREPVLSIQNLITEFRSPRGTVRAVDDVSYDVYPGETVGVVGESGSGKSVTALSVLGLVPTGGRVVSGRALLEGQDLLKMGQRQLRGVRGRDIAMVFQDPMSSLNPVMTVGRQLSEALLVHDRNLKDVRAEERAVGLLSLVGVPDAPNRARQYPHEFSGGMRQRAMIAMAIANNPKVLIADEPTTALDVTIQAQVLDVLQKAKRETNAATVLITHDLGLVAELADRVVVMYAGRVVETGVADSIFNDPRHPYTLGLMGSLPRLDADLRRLVPISGNPPNLAELPPGCAFHPRCGLRKGRLACVEQVPPLYAVSEEHGSACHFHCEMDNEVAQVADAMGVELTQRNN